MSDLTEANAAVKPIFAQSHFMVSLDGLITQVLIFYYQDEKLYYHQIRQDPVFLEEDLNKIAENMNQFLDQEKNFLNDERVFPRVFHAELFFNGSNTAPAIMLMIEFNGQVIKGQNV
ncbi:MAG: hypothetical protein ACXQS8_00990, partial [Candidatus Helarchaeales archaeon]